MEISELIRHTREYLKVLDRYAVEYEEVRERYVEKRRRIESYLEDIENATSDATMEIGDLFED